MLRENLALLVDAGLSHRQDRPDGKRYARKGAGRHINSTGGYLRDLALLRLNGKLVHSTC